RKRIMITGGCLSKKSAVTILSSRLHLPALKVILLGKDINLKKKPSPYLIYMGQTMILRFGIIRLYFIRSDLWNGKAVLSISFRRVAEIILQGIAVQVNG